MKNIEFILYVHDQQRSMEFYSQVLLKAPILNVPGMTEFELTHGVLLGLMPSEGIVKILKDSTPHPASAHGIPRCELYLPVDSPTEYLRRACEAGAVLVSAESDRDWGDSVAYCADPDGHILAFACPLAVSDS